MIKVVLDVRHGAKARLLAAEGAVVQRVNQCVGLHWASGHKANVFEDFSPNAFILDAELIVSEPASAIERFHIDAPAEFAVAVAFLDAGKDMDGVPFIQFKSGAGFDIMNFENLQRLVDCWNACRHLYRPAAHIAETDEYVKRLETLRREAWARAEQMERAS